MRIAFALTALALTLVSCGGSSDDDGDNFPFILESADLVADDEFCHVSGTVFNRRNHSCSLAMDFFFSDGFGTIVADAVEFIDGVPRKTRSAYNSTAIESRETGEFLTCDEVAGLDLDVDLSSDCD